MVYVEVVMIDLDSWTSISFGQPIINEPVPMDRLNYGHRVKHWCDENCQGKAMIDNVVGDVIFELESDAIMFSLKYL